MENEINSIPFEQLIKYVFDELPQEEYQRIEKMVLAEEYYLDLVQNILNYCDRENIYDSAALELIIQNQKNLVFEKLENNNKPDHPNKLKEQTKIEKKTRIEINKKDLWLLLLLVTCALAFVYLIHHNKQVQEEKIVQILL